MSEEPPAMARYFSGGLEAVEGWLGPIDADIFIALLRAQAGPLNVKGGVAEIGVHHGKAYLGLCLGLRPDEQGYCIDIFSEQHLNQDNSGEGDREALVRNLKRFGVPESQVVIRQASSFDAKAAEIIDAVGPIRFFSVDGGHWFEIVQNDMEIAEGALADGGVIAVDDFHRPEWPDVSAGYFAWCLKRTKPIVPFAIGFNKLYLCEDAWCERYQAVLASDPRLRMFLAKEARFQGVDLPVYSQYILPEYTPKQRVWSLLRLFSPELYIATRKITRNTRAAARRMLGRT